MEAWSYTPAPPTRCLPSVNLWPPHHYRTFQPITNSRNQTLSSLNSMPSKARGASHTSPELVFGCIAKFQHHALLSLPLDLTSVDLPIGITPLPRLSLPSRDKLQHFLQRCYPARRKRPPGRPFRTLSPPHLQRNTKSVLLRPFKMAPRSARTAVCATRTASSRTSTAVSRPTSSRPRRWATGTRQRRFCSRATTGSLGKSRPRVFADVEAPVFLLD